MKRFIAVLSGLLVLPAFAEVAPIYYDEIVEYTDEMIEESEQPESENQSEVTGQQQDSGQRMVIGRTTSRVAPAGNTKSRANNATRTVASSPRNAQQTSRGTVSRTVKAKTTNAKQKTPTRSRTSVVSRSAAGSTRTSVQTKPVTARVSATGNVISSTRTTNSSSSSNVLTDSGDPLYISSSSSARIAVGSRRSSARNSSVATIATAPVITNDDISTTTSNLDALAELTDYCKAQYAQCMDNYCNVLDDNQGRCSCSANIKNYQKTEEALAKVSENFQDVIQKIKYIGLSATQIEALFAETEAELAMKTNSDTSQLKSSLDAIKKKIVDVSSGKGTSGLLDGLSFDMSGLLDTDFSATFDLNSFLGNTKVSNQRGETLFNTATQRCRTAVLNSCVSQGIDASMIINSYDLAIDKQCAEYERSLNEATAEMRANVRNAQNVLQQARLLLAQQKNAYDLRGCVAALDECMQDEYVCGDEYEFCLDPTGKYLAHGEIVKGGTPGVAGGTPKAEAVINATNFDGWSSDGMYGLYSSWDYKESGKTYNAWGAGKDESVNAYIDVWVKNWTNIFDKTNTNKDDNNMATYLLRRVGYIDSKDDKSYGMCSNVLKQCQDFTFDSGKSNKRYKVDNEVVRQYLALASTKIKLKQDTILADYAETCWNDVYSCLSTNNYDENNTNNTTSKTAVNACRADIATCMSVTGYYPAGDDTLTLSAMTDWVSSKMISCPADTFLKVTYSDDTAPVKQIASVSCVPCGWGKCHGLVPGDIPATGNVSACSALDDTNVAVSLTSSGGQSTSCVCPSGFQTMAIDDSNASGSTETGISTKIECFPLSDAE